MATLGACAALVTATGVSALSAQATTAPSLTVSAAFAKTGYVSGQEVSVRISVHNSGTAAATGITGYQQAGATALDPDSAGLGSLDSGITVPAGHTVTVTVPGHPQSLSARTVTFVGDLFDHSGDGIGSVSASAPVKLRTARVRGTVFGDRNANGRADSGEGISGAKVDFHYRYGTKTYVVTTGRGGKFSAVVPTASYYLRGGGKGWTELPRTTTVSSSVTLNLRAIRPLTKALTASMHFTKSRYAVGARALLDIRLKNTGAQLRGIAPECNRAGDPGGVNNVGKAWGTLAVRGPGVVLPARSTRTFHIAITVTTAFQRTGRIAAYCDFGYPEIDSGYRPAAQATALVPGQSGALSGTVDYSQSSGATVGIEHVRVVLVDATMCPLAEHTTTSDTKGAFRFASVPAGLSYKLYLFPPKGWKVLGQNPTNAMILGRSTGSYYLQVAAGSAKAPTLPSKCT